MAFEPVRRRKRTAVSFAGCGFMGMYHVGIGLAIQELAPEEIDTFQMFYGASAGAIVAVFGACNLSAKEGYKFIKGLHDKAHGKWLGRLGALHPSFNLMDEVRSYLERILPKDAHRKCSKRVGISLTIFPDYKNWIVSDFNTRSELIQAVVCSCYIPFYCGVNIPLFRGKRCFDGGFTSNLPHANNPLVITISPFSGECDICPSGESESYYQLYMFEQTVQINSSNLYRGIGALLFLSWNEMEKLCEQGYVDAIKFLRSEGMMQDINTSAISEPITNVVIYTVSDFGNDSSEYFSMTPTSTHSRNSSITGIDEFPPVPVMKLYRGPKWIRQTMTSQWIRLIDKITNYQPHKVPLVLKLWELLQAINYGNNNKRNNNSNKYYKLSSNPLNYFCKLFPQILSY